jgi:hypothetical protein
MPEPIERVMQAYTLMATLSPQDEAEARERVGKHLAGISGDENALAVEGLRFLRGSRQLRRRRNRANDGEF